MDTMELTFSEESYITATTKWTCIFLVLILCALSINTLHQQQLKKLTISSDLLKQKSFLVSQMHDEMLLITRTQLQILQASSDQQVRDRLWYLSELVADHLIHYYQLKNIADESDINLLMKFRMGFDQWRNFNERLITYANVVSDSGFINTLNKVDMAFSQLDGEDNENLLLVSQLGRNNRFFK